MATASLSTLIMNILEEHVEQLRDDLKILEHQMQQSKDGMYITHNGEDALIVYASIRYKAYVPKRYQDLDVQFIEWDGGDLPLDIDVQIGYN